MPEGSKDDGKWRVSDWLDKGEARRMAKFTQFAIVASEMALNDAGWKPHRQDDREMTGVCLGSGIGNLDELYNTSIAYDKAVSYQWKIFMQCFWLLRYRRDIRKFHPYSFLSF